MPLRLIDMSDTAFVYTWEVVFLEPIDLVTPILLSLAGTIVLTLIIVFPALYCRINKLKSQYRDAKFMGGRSLEKVYEVIRKKDGKKFAATLVKKCP